MFTMAKLRDGSTYLANHLTANDYYSEKESVTGVWVGQGAVRLGIVGSAIAGHDEAFERLRCNQHPLTGRPLTARTGDGRIVFLDFQCSAPKSVSLLAVTFGDERLRQAHHEAVTVAFGELEQFAARRVRGGKAAWSEETTLTGNLCAARFEHDASRALDAQLHTHLVTANATYDAKAEKWFALTEREMVGAIRYAGKVYQNELARRVLEAGYEIETTRNDRGVIEGFEIAGVSAEDRAIASKRRARIEEEITLFREKHGRTPTRQEVHDITTRTRSEKLAEITTAEVRQRQRADFSPPRAGALDQLVSVARQRGTVVVAPVPASDALQTARDHLFERSCVKPGHEVAAEALNQQLGRLELDRVKQSLMAECDTDLISARANVAGLHAPYVTREGLRQELSAIEIVNTGRGACAPLGVTRFSSDSKLSPDQRQAVTTLLHSTDRICALRGVAGTGKTTTLQEVQRGLQAFQRTVFTCAPTTSATEVLRKEGFSNATTLSDFLQNAEKIHGAQLRRATFIVDEAGIASTRQGADLCELVKRHDARLILVGDTRQHSGVEAGDFLSVLENHSRLQTCELTDIRRQTEQAYRSAVKSMAQGQARIGLMAIDKLGRMHEAGADYIKRAAEDYVADLAAKKNTLLVAPTWDEIHRLTDHVRDSMKKRGMLGSGESVRVAEPLAWTKAQQQRSANYQPGHFLSLHRPIAPLNLKAGTTLEVTAVIRGCITVRAPDGNDVTLNPRQQSAAWSVAAPRVAEFAAGDRILIRQNHRAAGLVNGEVLSLESRAPSGAWNARNAEGLAKMIPADFRAFAHGYAITSHKSQGRTCDRVIVCAAQLDAKATYVAFSRARQEAVGYTPDKAALLERLPEVNRPRPAVVDFLPMLRPRRLRWVRAVIARVREMLSPRVAPVAPAITPAVDAPAIAQKPPVPALKVSTPESLLAPWPPHQSPRQGMRMSM